jgi:glycosyltransferase involved in cell wall biosynthesis
MTGMGEPLVSVVTPVYNGEETLAQCIESVLSQTYDNFEYLIQDNYSTDRTADIAASFARRDSRIRICRNPSLVTAPQNHDLAFRRMSLESRYCKVVHADDWIFPECLERMVALAEAHPTVAMVSAYRLEEEYVTLDGLPYPSTVVPGREICRRSLLGEVYVFGTPTSLILRTDVVRARDPFYDEVEFPRHCDTAVCYEILRNRDLGFVHQILTFTRRAGAARTAVSHRIGSSIPEHLGILKKYGADFLSGDEYKRRLREMIKSYYRYLGVSAFARPGREFWDYHRNELKLLGLSGTRLRLFLASVSAAVGSLLHPMRGLWRVFHPETGANG